MSAQSQDKDVLKYYKSRQASGSSQTGVAPGAPPSSAATLTSLLQIPSLQGLSPEQQQLSTMRTSPGGSMATANHDTLGISHQLTHRSALLPEALYGTLNSAANPNAPFNSASSQLYSSYSGGNCSTSAAVLADIYGTTGRGTAKMSSSNAANTYGTVGRTSGGAGGNDSLYGTSASILAAAESVSGGAVGPNAYRHSMNLSSSSNCSVLSSLILPSPCKKTDSASVGAGPPLYEHHLAHLANLELYGPPGSSKTLPSKHSNTQLLAISGNSGSSPRASYKDG